MNNIKIPGFVWVVLIAAAIVACENYLANPLYAEIAITLLLGVAKAVFVGTKELDELLALLRKIQDTTPVPRGMAVNVDERKPNKFERWLLG